MSAPTKNRFKPNFNFITVHYAYIVGITIFGSIIIYPSKNMRYIDALFFASGSATQSGLNPLDLNTIKLHQQITTYLMPMLTNPIFINSFVVFVRLYWFEKRFKNIVASSRLPSKARAQSKSIFDDTEEDADREERGVRGRPITVMHAESRAPSPYRSEIVEVDAARTHADASAAGSRSQSLKSRKRLSGDSSTLEGGPQQSPETAQAIQFADLPTPQREGNVNDPKSSHIAFVENQRSPSNHGKALRIPGPREFEIGHRAHEIEDDDDAHTLHRSRTTGEIDRSNDIGATASRTISLGNAASIASGNVRLRKLPTVERFLPRVSTIEQVVVSAFQMGTQRKRRNTSPSKLSRKPTKEPPNMPYLSYQPTIGRNSQFVDLTEEQRDELGGIEYRSLKLLAMILVGYFVLFHVFGVLCFLPWIHAMAKYKEHIISIGVNPTWWAIYTSQTAFNDLGFTLTPDSMASFQSATFILLIMAFLIIIGNTGFPCMLRFIIWIGFKLVPKNSSHKESLNFLLDHPRRCFTLLFPSRPTWMLFMILVVLNVSDVVLFIVLDINDPEVTGIPVGDRLTSAIFQAASTRTSGTSVLNIAELHPAVQVSYLVMMYISVFPIAISIRRTNVYEERSLGVYGGDDEEDDQTSYMGTHLRKQLSFDLWYIFLGLFVIAIAEGSHLQDVNDYAFTTFSVLFEVVSAYGTVGLSLGYPNTNTSFSARFGVVGKLVIIAMQIRGRHRGLPYGLDRAILLPSEKMHETEQEDATLRAIRRRGSSFSQTGNNGQPLARPLTRQRSVASQAIEDCVNV